MFIYIYIYLRVFDRPSFPLLLYTHTHTHTTHTFAQRAKDLKIYFQKNRRYNTDFTINILLLLYLYSIYIIYLDINQKEACFVLCTLHVRRILFERWFTYIIYYYLLARLLVYEILCVYTTLALN